MLLRLRRDFCDATMLLTRLPIAWLRGDASPGDPAACVWAYPIVGLLVGSIGVLVDFLARRLGMPAPVAAVWCLAAMILATGGLHEDGLADTADGFGGGRDVARKLAIMRDSRIGVFGALALILAFAARATSIAALPDPSRAILAAAVTGRAAMIVPLLMLRPARGDGLAAGLRDLSWREAICGLATAAVFDWLLLPDRTALLIIIAAALGSFFLARVAQNQIGGYTGDLLGATEQGAEIVSMTAIASVISCGS